MAEYFSDNELGKQERVKEELPVSVWNGIVAVYEKFKAENHFSSSFPEQCPDRLGICGFDDSLFEDRVKAEIPNLNVPIQRKQEEVPVFMEWESRTVKTVVDKYSTLDFLEFCHQHIKKPIKGTFHDFFGHYHLTFQDDLETKKVFRDELNKLFERNGIVFFLNNQGQINRTTPEVFQTLTNKIFQTPDHRLNELTELAYDKFILPKLDDRINALEKIWDAFERVKTYYSSKKNVSADQLLDLVSKGNTHLKDELTKEAKSLTDIGNKFQIRHFETDKIEITDNKHIDYLFYRMISLIHLILTELELE
ncbi:AbiJ-NTD4 domain-containing protein [Ekhidna sp. To15]|uniref:AbiJ-NTD4 domain-containing protein n=1 Tax=Ekhidna sp. To15 TaxID=3395267 RepID=UPI003F52763A